ncbi:hypothetical protein HMN09_00145400 [Mycena chlorophos]|uniref:Protein CPL1-like domain-containing protein n=1 Tax=Mycena chlorophos TaxID=658473 RepID=A0A8H6TKP0_MYCCL|nr:hypothetical protein HMN09_00145400 [Mycena chlorophos]
MRFASIALLGASLFTAVAASSAIEPLLESRESLMARTSGNCNDGQYWSNGQCHTCPAGKYSTQGYKPSCKTCPTGSTSTAGSGSCTCQPGYFAAGGGTVTTNACSVCSAGYISGSGASECTECSANTKVSNNQCVACSPGYISDPGSTSCSPACPAGQYYQNSMCYYCPDDTYSLGGTTSCTTCPVSTGCQSGQGTSAAECKCKNGQVFIAGACAPEPSGANYRRSTQTALDRCSPLETLCPISSGIGSQSGMECLNVMTQLDSCGGCVAPEGDLDYDSDVAYTGRDCTLIPNVDEVWCEKGGCVVGSCQHGYSLVNNTCVRQTKAQSKKHAARGHLSSL